MKVVVVGGGIGGLLLANALHARGAALDSGGGAGAVEAGATAAEPPALSVTVLERDTSPAARAQGYYIGLQPNGIAALREAAPGLLDRVLATAWKGKAPRSTQSVDDAGEPGDGTRRTQRSSDSFTFMNEKARAYFVMKMQDDPHGRFATASLHRQRLRDELLREVGAGVRWGAQVSDIDAAGPDGRVRVTLEDGSVVDADVLVGADGVHSVVRQHLLSDELDDVGVRILGGAVPDVGQLDALSSGNGAGSGSLMAVGKGASMFVGRYDSRSDDGIADEVTGTVVINFGFGVAHGGPAGAAALEAPGAEELRDTVLKLMEEQGWHACLQRVVRETPLDRLRMRDLQDRLSFAQSHLKSPSAALPSGRITLLGDAGHAMTPYQGQGGNNAMASAVALGEELASVAAQTAAADSEAVSAALKRFETQVYPTAAKWVIRSRQSCDIMHAHGPQALMRNGGLFCIGKTMGAVGVVRRVGPVRMAALAGASILAIASLTYNH